MNPRARPTQVATLPPLAHGAFRVLQNNCNKKGFGFIQAVQDTLFPNHASTASWWAGITPPIGVSRYDAWIRLTLLQQSLYDGPIEPRRTSQNVRRLAMNIIATAFALALTLTLPAYAGQTNLSTGEKCWGSDCIDTETGDIDVDDMDSSPDETNTSNSLDVSETCETVAQRLYDLCLATPGSDARTCLHEYDLGLDNCQDVTSGDGSDDDDTGCAGRDCIVFENVSGDEIGFMVDGADASGDFNSRVYTTSDATYELSYDVLGRSDDQEEVTAFSKRRPPFARNPASFQEGSDLVSIRFEDEITLDFTVWIVDVDSLNTVNNRTNETLDSLAYAEERWKAERVGLALGDVRVVDKTGDPQAHDLRDCETCGATYFSNLASEIGLDSGRINIYLTRKAVGSRYYGVAERGGDQIAMGMYTGGADLLMHEIAHNFTLQHTDNTDDHFDSKNVAVSIASIWNRRESFSEGQTFRAHFEPTSAINDTYSARPGLYTVSCTHSITATVACPRIQKRIWADDGFPAN